MGRPKVPNSKRRGIIVNARLSPEENKEIRAAIAKSLGNKSEWLRKRLAFGSARKSSFLSQLVDAASFELAIRRRSACGLAS